MRLIFFAFFEKIVVPILTSGGPNEVTNRTKIEPLAQQKLAESLVQKYGEDVVFVNKVVINDMNFEDAYNEAIQQKSIAQQNADKQKIQKWDGKLPTVSGSNALVSIDPAE